MIRQLLQVKLWWLSVFLFLVKRIWLAFLRDSILCRVELSKIMIFITEKMNEKIYFLAESKEEN